MTALESKHEAELRKAVTAAGGLCFKLPASLYRGISDRLVLLPGGRVWFIELKRAGASTNPRTGLHQEKFRKAIFTLGLNHVRLEGPDQLKEWIHEHIR